MVKASLSVRLKLPAPVNASDALLKPVDQLCVAATLRSVIFALVAARETFKSPSDTSLALIVNAAG